MSDVVVEARALRKAYDGRAVVDGLDLTVRAGEVYGLLGPNGAGKTTTTRMLVTLTRPDGGTATIAGCDVVGDPDGVRAAIGYVPQELIADKTLTAHENARFCARLHHLRGAEREARIEEALKLVNLWDERDKRVRKFSGGMRKKLDLACGLLNRPKLLLLDEPSLGLDVPTRRALWDHVLQLRDQGLAIILCTNAMEEADALASRIGIIDRGRLVAEDTPQALKAGVGGEVVVLEPADPAQLETLASALDDAVRADRELHVTTDRGAEAIPRLVERARSAGVTLARVGFHGPTLEDAFLAHTGRAFAAAGGDDE